MTPVATSAEVGEITAEVAAASLVTFDLEFLAQDRLIPTLCLIQVSWLPAHVSLDVPAGAIVATDPELALVDPLATDVRALVEALAAHPRVIAHAPRQDLALLASRFGIAMPGIADTQVMAAFAGYGEQVGLATLAKDLLSVTHGKELQWTDWARRPLSDAQLAYAAADVRYLPALWAILRDRLGERMPWAMEESALVAADALAAASVSPDTAWRQLGGLRGVDAKTTAAAVALAAWRLRTAIELDRPLGQVLHDKSLLDLARHRPTTASGVRATKGVSGVVKQRADDIVASIAGAQPHAVPAQAPTHPPSPRAQRWAEILLTITHLASEQTGVAARLLATRADAEELARRVDERGLDAARSLPAFATWRREVLGARWEAWLTGRAVLVADATSAAGVALQESPG